LGNLGSLLTGILRDSWRAPEREHLSAGTLLGGLLSGDPEGHGEEGSGDEHHYPWGPIGELNRGSSTGAL